MNDDDDDDGQQKLGNADSPWHNHAELMEI